MVRKEKLTDGLTFCQREGASEGIPLVLVHLGDQAARYAALRDFRGDILMITGAHDAIIPPDHIARVRALLPPHLHCVIEAEHNLLLTHPDDVADAVRRWTT